MASVSLTERTLRSLRTDQQREDFYDASFPAFMVRVSRRGTKAFCYRYRGEDGKYRRMDLGRYPEVGLADARLAARELEVQARRGKDPAQQQEVQAEPVVLTVSDLVSEYVERYASRHQKSWRVTQRVLSKDVLPVLGHRLLAEVKRREISSLVERIYERGAPQGANQALKMLRGLFNWAVQEEMLESNPCNGLQKPAPASSRDRNLSETEIFQVWHSLQRRRSTAAVGLRLMLFLGQRGHEVRHMRWRDIEGDLWTIPREDAKSGREHVVPLSSPAQAVIEACRGKSDVWVLPSPRLGGPEERENYAHAVETILREEGMEPWTPHDLRRTVASGLARLGVQEFVIQRVLGHAYSSVTATYNRYSYVAEKREALERWGQRLLKIVSEVGGGGEEVS